MRRLGSIRVTTDRGRCPPPPPFGFKASLDTAQVKTNPTPWVRLFWHGRDPLGFGTSTSGNRFDPLAPPWRSTAALYAGTSLETAIAEVILRWHSQIVPGQPVSLSEAGQLAGRWVARFEPKRALTLIDATELSVAAIESVVTAIISRPEHKSWQTGCKPLAEDIFQCGPGDYPLTQQWGAWFRSQCPDAHGIMWVSRQFNTGRCFCLFDDRCRSELDLVEPPVPLYKKGSVERDIFNRMLGKLHWGIEK
jgi:hypothetical protein